MHIIKLIISLEKFHKSRLYGLDKSNFGFISSTFSQCEVTNNLNLIFSDDFAFVLASPIIWMEFVYRSCSKLLRVHK